MGHNYVCLTKLWACESTLRMNKKRCINTGAKIQRCRNTKPSSWRWSCQTPRLQLRGTAELGCTKGSSGSRMWEQIALSVIEDNRLSKLQSWTLEVIEIQSTLFFTYNCQTSVGLHIVGSLLWCCLVGFSVEVRWNISQRDRVQSPTGTVPAGTMLFLG